MRASRAVRLAQLGLAVNGLLALVKLVAGIVGHSQALIADATESFADLFSSVVVWGGVRIADRAPDDDHPFGHGKAEALAAGVVGVMLLGAALTIAIGSIREIVRPHHVPAPFTLAVLVGVVVVKEGMFRVVRRGAAAIRSPAVAADAWHHRSDAITSSAAFLGISVALIGGPGWEAADDVAALLASAIIVFNGLKVLRPAVDELMDHAPDSRLLSGVARAATAVPGVLAIEKLRGRKQGRWYFLELHVQADPGLSLHEAHILSGMVKSAIRSAEPEVANVLVHMEPYRP
ncbi:MAG TPA: cation diffusion facilitator family transporter [Gemmatimonadales bacterium]